MLVSCSAQNDADTKSIAQPLIERSLELDVILYGKGLSVSEEEKNGKYSKVIDTELTSIDKIRDACAEVYTGELCEIIENSVLRGKTGDEEVHKLLIGKEFGSVGVAGVQTNVLLA